MIQKIMKCGLIGGFILFVWGAVSWTVLPWQKNAINSFSSESDVRSSISDNITGSGIYILPNLKNYANNPQEMAAAKERMREGPFIFAAVAAEGRNPHMVGAAIQSLILKIIAACLVTWLLLHTNITDISKSVKFVTVVGIVVALLATVPYGIWFAFPGSFVIGMIIEIVFGWFFAGLAIARLVKKK